MKAIKIIWAIVGVVVVAPIWYYLLFKILVAVHATELMWFLYWIYFPVALLLGALKAVQEAVDKP